jgi:hypothetical protein
MSEQSAAAAAAAAHQNTPPTVAAHISAELHVDTQNDTTAALVSKLSAARCRSLTADAEEHLDKEMQQQRDARRLDKLAARKNAAADDNHASHPASCEFEPADVYILNMLISPPRKVATISAFGLNWRPVGKRKQLVATSDSHAEWIAVGDNKDTEADNDKELVQFVSVQRAAFAIPPSDELASHQQRLKQLPIAIEANKVAMAEAEVSGELADVGALYLEQKRLKEELDRLQHSDMPAGRDIVYVHDMMQLSLGLVSIDDGLYFLQRTHANPVHNRQLTVMQIRSAGTHITPDPLGQVCKNSDILRRHHKSALLRLLDGQSPVMNLLWSGKRDGMTTSDFHRLCNDKGPTLTIIRTRLPNGNGHIIGGWAGESWTSLNRYVSAHVWLFSLGDAASTEEAGVCVSKYRPHSSTTDILCHTSNGPAFGTQGCALAVLDSIKTGNSHYAHLGGCHLQAGYKPIPGGIMGGANAFGIDSIEVWACPM